METCCDIKADGSVRFSSLFDALAKWCDDTGDNLPKKRFASSWLREAGYQDETNNGLWFFGISLKPPAAPKMES